MRLIYAALVLGLGLGTAWAQNPDVINDTRSTLQNVQKTQVNNQNAALAVSSQNNSVPHSTPASVTVSIAPAKPSAASPAKSHSTTAQVKPAKAGVASARAHKKSAAQPKKKSTAIAVNPPANAQKVAVEDKKNPVEPKKEEPKTYSANGRRDPFISPVVNRSMTGSGCSTGKRCLAIDQINLQGIVKSDAGMIAVVVNALNKAYFLHENDPVFNGYVVKITGDSIIFKETLQDKMGKSFEREVTKKISTPAA